VECEKADDDPRKENYKIKGDIRVVGHVGTDFNWAERNSIVLPLISKNFSELEDKGASLGLIRPSEIIDFYREKAPKSPLGDNIKEHRRAVQMIFENEGNFVKMRPIPVIKKSIHTIVINSNVMMMKQFMR
jgi:hypothetical protein